MVKHNNFLLSLGHKIRFLRENKGISLNKFAYENDFTKSGLSKIETGQSDPRASTLQKISCGLGISFAELVKNL